MRNNIIKGVELLIFLAIGAVTVCGQEPDEAKAAQLHNRYQFEAAAEIYGKLLETCTDSLKRIELENKVIQSENGMNLLNFAFSPEVVAKMNVPRATFFLHYPGMEDSTWADLTVKFAPQMTEDNIDGEFKVIHYPENVGILYFSAPDESGAWNIYSSKKLNDTLWGVPMLMNEHITSAGNELFPIVSSDGKLLYFASNGHYGVGGYDLYVSEWDEELQDWGVPQNMGFPYSSPADDLFFYNTPDGLYSIFASDRDAAGDTLTLYAMAFDNVPLKRAYTSEEAYNLSKLELPKKEKTTNGGVGISETSKDDEYSNYTLAVSRMRECQQKLNDAISRQDENRELYNRLTNEDDLKALEKKIQEQEVAMLALQNELNSAVSELQKLEMEFLMKGIFIPQVEEVESGDDKGKEEAAQEGAFAFADMKMGVIPDSISVEVPEPEIDLSFRIQDEALLVDLAEIPSGLVYQIQLFTLSKPVSLKALKGLAPVFERKSPSGKYLYFAGVFKSYNDALSNLNKVRRRGFPSALITAYNNGKSMSVKSARILEKEIAESVSYQVLIGGYEVLPQELITVIRSTTEKDLAKSVVNGVQFYVVGPFSKLEEAETLAAALRGVDAKSVEIKKVE